MLGIDTVLHLRLPSESKQRILHPAKIVGMKDNVLTAEIEELDLPVESGQDVLVYYEANRTFMQQCARIETIEETEPKLLVSLTTTGTAVSAESRERYRVSTVMMEITAGIGKERICPVVDVSTTGFSVIAKEQYSVGDVVDASLLFDDQINTGKVCIQSVRELSKGRIRYGCHSVDKFAARSRLTSALEQMSVKIQREQLRRLAGAI